MLFFLSYGIIRIKINSLWLSEEYNRKLTRRNTKVLLLLSFLRVSFRLFHFICCIFFSWTAILFFQFYRVVYKEIMIKDVGNPHQYPCVDGIFFKDTIYICPVTRYLLGKPDDRFLLPFQFLSDSLPYMHNLCWNVCWQVPRIQLVATYKGSYKERRRNLIPSIPQLRL